MKSILAAVAVVLCSFLNANADTIKIAGSGQMLPLATSLGKGYMKKHPGDVVEVNLKSLGQKNGVEAVSEGYIDIATSARRLGEEERRLQVKPYEVATVAGFFAVNASVPVRGLTSREICDIYSGKITNWKQVGGKDAKIVVMTRPEKDSTKIVLRQQVPGFAKVEEPPTVQSKLRAKDMMTSLANTPDAIGMVDAVNYADAGGKFIALKLDGKDITSSITGPIQHHYQFVLNKNPSPADLRFIQFVRSPEGQAIIRQEKANPVKF